ncbi:CHAT domain-containing protein [Chitinophaga pinensis]|uniref:CHAT domain-containing protein n=1 Tax=Chitinophaga pinensis TaxID=79329 RepID=A0A5C6M2L4_9BACT|nr:CHAT domain-containing protein [Chitinophaga pinensis]TWW02219.1 CHAT domain-containing protein [Chitinophaga pinensis]
MQPWGEIPGKRIRSEFIDGSGIVHSIEYDHVLSFAATPYKNENNGEPLIEVHYMVFPRSYNGFKVGSDELKAQHYSPEFFVECQNAVIHRTTVADVLVGEVSQVTDSRAVMCSDYPFYGMINYIAGGMKPLIFNNTCWSWGPIATSFLQKGAKGYIGTLWGVKDDSAASTAVAFYENMKTIPIAEAIHMAAHQHQPAEDKDIYVFYGFPFTALHSINQDMESKKLVLLQLTRRREFFLRNRRTTTDTKVQQRLDFIIAWHDIAIQGIQG